MRFIFHQLSTKNLTNDHIVQKKSDCLYIYNTILWILSVLKFLLKRKFSHNQLLSILELKKKKKNPHDWVFTDKNHFKITETVHIFFHKISL